MSKFRYRELRSIVLGEKLGEGISRVVHECRLNPDYVVKLELKGGSFQNIAEYETWTWVSGTPMAKWFAPCHMISSCGAMLIQRKVEPIRAAERPKMLPAYLCDMKRENFGMLDKRIVCCDYGTVPSAIRSASKRLVRVKWRS